ncbi:MAG: rhomboid family intramembrane serine protease [Acidobacteriaceae bacterium]
MPEPEILPPGAPDPAPSYTYQQQIPQQPPPMPGRPRRRSGWASAPATYVLCGINIAVFLLMVLNGVSATAPNSLELVHWGANYGGAVLIYGEWWRLLTATFVHVGIIHLATNMWCLWNLGLLGEPLLGPVGLLCTYLLTGIAGNLLSVGVHPEVVGAGASGAVFGLAGVLILLLGSPVLPVPKAEVQRLRRSVIYFAVFNFVIGGSTWFFHTSIQIDNMAHLGGFLSGLALGLPLVPRVGSRRATYIKRQWIAYGGMLLVILLGARFIANFRH